MNDDVPESATRFGIPLDDVAGSPAMLPATIDCCCGCGCCCCPPTAVVEAAAEDKWLLPTVLKRTGPEELEPLQPTCGSLDVEALPVAEAAAMLPKPATPLLPSPARWPSSLLHLNSSRWTPCTAGVADAGACPMLADTLTDAGAGGCGNTTPAPPLLAAAEADTEGALAPEPASAWPWLSTAAAAAGATIADEIAPAWLLPMLLTSAGPASPLPTLLMLALPPAWVRLAIPLIVPCTFKLGVLRVADSKNAMLLRTDDMPGEGIEAAGVFCAEEDSRRLTMSATPLPLDTRCCAAAAASTTAVGPSSRADALGAVELEASTAAATAIGGAEAREEAGAPLTPPTTAESPVPPPLPELRLPPQPLPTALVGGRKSGAEERSTAKGWKSAPLGFSKAEPLQPTEISPLSPARGDGGCGANKLEDCHTARTLGVPGGEDNSSANPMREDCAKAAGAPASGAGGVSIVAMADPPSGRTGGAVAARTVDAGGGVTVIRGVSRVPPGTTPWMTCALFTLEASPRPMLVVAEASDTHWL
mmetsp:Transcript_7873/g.19999  ORF Transcript_7873/g.19999 Transcript_7873/m.19999 type:complete len:533 (+) Transcript_7873:446-2044(+)